MKFSIQDNHQSADLLVLGLNESNHFPPFFSKINENHDNYWQNHADFLPKMGNGRLFFVPNLPPVLVIRSETSQKALLTTGALIAKTARDNGWKKVFCAVAEIAECPKSAVKALAEGAGDGDYVYEVFKSNKRAELDLEIQFNQSDAQEALHQAQAYLLGNHYTRDLVNCPPNVCTPKYLGEQALDLAKQYDTISVEVLDKNAITQLGMGGVLAVGQGSVNEPRFIVFKYQPKNAKNTQPIVLVGKGVTFDTGGISIKPAQSMDEMKGDMGGAGAVFGALKALAEEQLPVFVVGIVASVENMPDGNAFRPGDIITSLSGKTIEVLNTDAEGRLILMDALTYAERFNPQAVIEMSTLTGAIVIALGSHRAGLMGNNEALQEALFQAGQRAGDWVWKLPLDNEYKEMMKSPFADVANISGSREAGSLTAGAFLSHFTENYPWAHLDIAGVSFKSGNPKGGTGRPVGLLLEYFRAQ